MKPELTNLLDRLKSHPGMEGFQTIHIFPSGRAQAFYRHGAMNFADLTALELFAYNQSATTDPNPAPAR